jgi:Sulfotransferase domain
MSQGPSWIGIGAQRSGTTWVSRLLVQHPEVDFGTNGKKEQAYLHLIPQGKLSEEGYLEFFPDDGVLRGDWSPHYMPSMIVPHIAARVVRPDAPIFVLLRDPVERLASGMRYAKRTNRIPTDFHEPWLVRAHQYGQYAASLEGWTVVFPRDRFVILTYEEALEDVQKACELFWGAMGLDPHPLTDPHRQVKRRTEGTVDWKWPDGTREALVAHYLPQIKWLRDHWGVDVYRWRNFEGLLD